MKRKSYSIAAKNKNKQINATQFDNQIMRMAQVLTLKVFNI